MEVTRIREILSMRGHRLEREEDTNRRNLCEVWVVNSARGTLTACTVGLSTPSPGKGSFREES